MFTGIISDIGIIESARRGEEGDLRLVISCGYDMDDVAIGASIACSGACLTVVDKQKKDGRGHFAVDVSDESVARTVPGLWDEGQRLNLERAARLGDELGGHIVTGHVDGVGEVVSETSEGGSTRVAVRVPAEIAPYIAPKGSITLDGVSLTVNEVEDRADGTVFGVNIIPHTAEVTTLGGIAAGRKVNLEIDILARYLARMKAHIGG